MAEAEPEDVSQDEPTGGQEEALKAELKEQTLHLEALKKRLEELRAENDLLQEEAHQTRVESHEYMSYMEKKSRKRQTVIISLNDRNLKELQDTSEQRQKMMADFDKQKASVQKVLLDKEKQLVTLKKEMHELSKFQVLQDEQEAEIARLEQEVATMKEKHTERTQALKAEFLHSQTEFEKEERARVAVLQRQANSVAGQYLHQHVSDVCAENRALRKELQQLMDMHKELNLKKKHLSAQHNELQRQLQVQRDLANMYIGSSAPSSPAQTSGVQHGALLFEADSQAAGVSGRHSDTHTPANSSCSTFLPQLQMTRTVTT